MSSTDRPPDAGHLRQPQVLRPGHILLVEDDPADAALVRRALARETPSPGLSWVEDGDQAMAYLRREAGFAAARPVDLVLLDLNMPRRGGHSVLAEIRDDPALAELPVVVLTTSGSIDDVQLSYRLHANAFVRKPMGTEGFQTAVGTLRSFWFSVVALPGARP